VRRWEYKKIALNDETRRGNDIDLLCEAGGNGWELVAVLPNGVAYLKREVAASFSKPAEGRSYKPPQTEPVEAEITAANGGAVTTPRCRS
jgi:hypothetical protein